MSGAGSPHPDRVMELLADKALQGLSPAAASELSLLPDADSEALELAAAALDLAMNPGPYEDMPASLRTRIESDALEARSFRGGGDVVARIGARPRTSGGAALAWLAAAACLILAITAWWPRIATTAGPRAEQAYQQLVKQAPDLTRWDWKAIGELENAPITGEVVWSTARQEGYMVFGGLPANAPTREQYQLWIFDPAQSEKTPIDGGVFDVVASADGRVIIPIDPKLRPTGPTLFAVTIEKPGGVVVSDRTRIVAIAAPAS